MKIATIIIALLLNLNCKAQTYTAPIQNVSILGNQSFKKVVPFTVFNNTKPNALSVFYNGGVNEQNVTLEWYLYHIDTVISHRTDTTITHSGLLGLQIDTTYNVVTTYTYPYQIITSGEETITDGDLTTFASNKNYRFYYIATKKGFTIQ